MFVLKSRPPTPELKPTIICSKKPYLLQCGSKPGAKKIIKPKLNYFQVIETERSSQVKLSPPQLLSPKHLELSNVNNF